MSKNVQKQAGTSAPADDEMTRALNLFVRINDNLMRAYVCHGFVRFLDAHLRNGRPLGTYELHIPSDSMRCYRATIDLTGAASLAIVLQRDIVWHDGTRRQLASVVGNHRQVSYWSNLFVTYRYGLLPQVDCITMSCV
jgi:hypothetical protein